MHPAELSPAVADPGHGVRSDSGRHPGLIEFVAADQALLHTLVQNLRREDAETLELADKDPREAYWRLLSRSMHAGAALVDGRPAAMWGAAVDNFLQTDFAHLWLLIGGDIKRPAHVIARGALPFVQQMQTCYGRLLTTVAWGHERDHRWVRWLGFRRCPEQDRRTERGVFLAYERD